MLAYKLFCRILRMVSLKARGCAVLITLRTLRIGYTATYLAKSTQSVKGGYINFPSHFFNTILTVHFFTINCLQTNKIHYTSLLLFIHQPPTYVSVLYKAIFRGFLNYVHFTSNVPSVIIISPISLYINYITYKVCI
jgi:hypothetical protein